MKSGATTPPPHYYLTNITGGLRGMKENWTIYSKLLGSAQGAYHQFIKLNHGCRYFEGYSNRSLGGISKVHTGGYRIWRTHSGGDSKIREKAWVSLQIQKRRGLTPRWMCTVVRKIDLHLVSSLCLLFIFNILDRSNIANARLGGMQSDLGLSDTQYQTAVAIMVSTHKYWSPTLLY